ncbi:hypothetical protein GCM10022407_10550 [Hymenobacter antarcticus]|uniref:Uncharacterized protein n=1 Tax=Hymenobacter antarcticus TaxID=486270 RepID=A0ABP7PJM0_9BACT
MLTRMPPTIPEITPASSGAPEASEMPRHSGKATRKTTKPAGASCPMVLNNDLLEPNPGSDGRVGAGGAMGAPVRAGVETICVMG